jgi:hypothetical protein
LVKRIPKWAEGSIVVCRKIPLLSKSGRQMLSSKTESDCVEVEASATQAASPLGIGRGRIRPQGNRTAKEEHKNSKL